MGKSPTVLKLGSSMIEIDISGDEGVIVSPVKDVITKREAKEAIGKLVMYDQMWSVADLKDQMITLDSLSSGTVILFETRWCGDRGNGIVFGEVWEQKERISSRVVKIGTIE